MSKGETKGLYKKLENLQCKLENLQLSIDQLECNRDGGEETSNAQEEYTYKMYKDERKKALKEKNNKNMRNRGIKQKINTVYNKWLGEEEYKISMTIFALICALLCFGFAWFGSSSKYIMLQKDGRQLFICLGIYILIYIGIAMGSKCQKLEIAIRIIAILWVLPCILLKIIFERFIRMKTLYKYIGCTTIIIIGMVTAVFLYLYFLWGMLVWISNNIHDSDTLEYIKNNIFTEFIIALLALMVMYYVPLLLFWIISNINLSKKIKKEYIKINKANLGVEKNAYLLVDKACKREISLLCSQAKLFLYVILIFIMFRLQNNSNISFIFKNSTILIAFNFFIIIDSIFDKWMSVKE